MGSSKNYPLPIILVSAKDKSSATALISELIGNSKDPREEQCNVWKIENKYYSADVEFVPLCDGDHLEAGLIELVEAHIVYLTENEVEDAVAMERRAGPGGAAGVRLVVTSGAASRALRAAASRARLELVELGGPHSEQLEPDEGGEGGAGPGEGGAGPGEGPDAGGAGRVRAALHAHPWSGLRRRDRRALESHSSSSSGDGDDGEGEGEEGEWSSWQSADQFAAALSALPAAAAAARAAGRRGAGAGAGGAERAERLARAEHVVAAFCRAIGEPLD